MSDIQREQLEAFTEANARAAAVLEKLTGIMEAMAKGQERLSEKITTEVPSAIINGINSVANNSNQRSLDIINRVEDGQKDILVAINTTMPSVVEEKISNSDMARDITHVKWFVGIVGIIVITSMVILKVTGFGGQDRAVQMQTQILQNILEKQNHGELKNGSNEQ